ncbi:ATP-grasp domain-containing protein [Streptomyces sp. MUM 203J]|uniref:ATP-grasp domain-containing protein n=1 Tax=Streptomyces sp. MUM 203J TaxID=2791990 RepID=UPI001F04292D|nr:ATP-grasp domain-containing protein [Streptomyces sp. MUM 203J]MCH0539310.1 ATP-grasp domain-containing protein [Streptomyces sp. MUM 203J]
MSAGADLAVSTGTAPLYVVLNRSGDLFGEYHRFLDGAPARLVYLTTPGGLAALDQEGAVEVRVLDSLGYEDVLPVVREIADRHGTPDVVYGQSEYDILTAARLSAELGVRGGYGVELVRRFKDKPTMKQVVGGAGLRVPRFHTGPVESAESLVEALGGLPLVLKPRDSAGSQGVSVVRDLRELAEALEGVDPAGYECEEYVEGEILHVDGVYRKGSFHFVSVSRYVHTCLDYARGRPLGSVMLDEGPEQAGIAAFAGRCLDALGLRDGAFHLEAIRPPGGEPVFLEVGLRPGGAQVPFVHLDLYGIDLFAEAFRAAVGLPPLWSPHGGSAGSRGGWLIYPAPGVLPSRVVHRTSLLGAVPEVYHEELPHVGQVMTGPGSYDEGSGIFRFRAESASGVARAVTAVLDGYGLRTEPADGDGPQDPLPAVRGQRHG